MGYKITLSDIAHKKIQWWTKRAVGEVGGMGIGEYDPKTNEFVVSDAFLVDQVVTGSSTDLDETALGKLMFKTANLKGDLNFWWHSHANMDVFWSGTDRDTILKFGGAGFIFASVFNKKDEVRSACAFLASSALNDNKPETIFYDDIDTFIQQPSLPKELTDALEKDFVDMVKPKVYAPTTQQTFLDKHLGGSYPYGRGFNEYMAMEYGDYGDWNESFEVDKVATQNITDATKQVYEEGYFDMTAKPLSNEDLNQLCQDDTGAFGYGFKHEAAALKLTHKTYRRIIKNNRLDQLSNLEERVLQAAASGILKLAHTY